MSASERTFGVEIECGNTQLNYMGIKDIILKAKIPLFDNGVGVDGSGIEVRSSILKGEEGYETLTNLMNLLNKHKCYVTRQDGMHVHIGAPELNKDEEACRILAETWFCNQVIIGKLFSAHRYRCFVQGTQICKPLVADDVETWGQTVRGSKSFGNDRFKALSLCRVPDRNTVEFRVHEGCLDPEKAVAWVKFCQALVEHAVTKREVLKCASKIVLLKKLGVPEDAIKILRKPQPLMPEQTRVYANA